MKQIRVPLVLAVLLVACASPAGQGDALNGRTFLSTGVTDGGADRPLVDNTRIRLTFADGSISAQAGCNTIGGTYRVENGQLVFEGGGMTEMGCDDELHAQDDWVSEVLGSRPQIAVAGNGMTLTSGGVVITLLDREVADPDLPFIGTTWTVSSIITGEAVSSVPAGAVATFEFADDGTVAINTGCNMGGGSYEVDGDTISFTDIAVTEMACADEGGILEGAVLPLLGADGVTFSIDAGSLTLMAGDNGLGLSGE